MILQKLRGMLWVALFLVLQPSKVAVYAEEVLAKAVDSHEPRLRLDPLKVIYMTSWVAAHQSLRADIVKFIKASEINAVVIDVKDYSGTVSFDTGDPAIEQLRTEKIRCKDLQDFIQALHTHNIYVIARITVFQDPLYAIKFPSEAIQSKKHATTWQDFKGLAYIDPASKKFWKYIVCLSRACKTVGFDEINYDYIRFPTDGYISDMQFPLSLPQIEPIPDKQFVTFRAKGEVVMHTTKEAVSKDNDQFWVEISFKTIILQEFYKYLHQEVREKLSIPISGDLFGMTLTDHTDLNIGQVLEIAAPYFDYIAPMIYPSHYPSGFQGFKKPANYPYEIVSAVLKEGVRRLKRIGYPAHKLRPWLQDFNLGAIYDATKVNAQKKGVYDAGLRSWFIWNPSNKYLLDKYIISTLLSRKIKD
ncbi:MAG: putative glycoside hydrolase [Amoebophilaceae bacterium]|nr:putative glycoside hydrolase [Amoebophilaceae bacterium]